MEHGTARGKHERCLDFGRGGGGGGGGSHRTAHTQGLAVFLTYAPPLTVSPQMSKRDRRTAGEEREPSEGETGRKKEETQNGELNEQRIAQRIIGNVNDNERTVRRMKRNEQ